MGNNQSQRKNHTNLKTKTKEHIKKLFLIKKDWYPLNSFYNSLFSKLSQKTSSLITSFLNIQEFENLIQVSKTTYQIFSQTSGCFQIACQRLLNVKCEIIQSQNWKIILQSVMCIPIRSLPYGEAIKSVRYETKQFPLFIEHKINYSGFQKAILYYEDQFSDEKQLIKNSDYITALQFATNNTDILLRVRQGFEIHTQLPELLMLIYNLHDYVFSMYKRFTFQFHCNLEQFIQIWLHYQGWISSIENQTSNLVFLFNKIIDESLPQYKLPKYTVRHFMVCEWMMKANKAELIEKFRKEFSLFMIECRNRKKKSLLLRQYKNQFLILFKYLCIVNKKFNCISTNQNNIHKYGYYNFQYCEELNQLINLTVNLTPKLNIEYSQHEELLIYIFGQYVQQMNITILFSTSLAIYEYYIFEQSSAFRVEQFKYEIKQFHQECQQMSKILVKNFEEQHNSIFGNEIQNFRYQLSLQQNVQIKIRALFKQVVLMDDDIQNSSENIVAESLGTSGVSLTSTNCSSVFSSVKNNDQLYHYIKFYQKDLFNKIQRFYCKEWDVYQYSLEQEPANDVIYDIPELAEYDYISHQNVMELFFNRIQRSNAIYSLERRQTILTSNYQFNHQYLQTHSLNQSESLLKCLLK